MNEKNTNLFFEQDDETVYITLTDEDGKECDGELIAVLNVEELNKEFAAVLPVEEEESDSDEAEVLLFGYSEDENGDPVFSDVDDEEEYDIVATAFNQFFSGEAEVEEDSPLGNEGDLFPGQSVSDDDK